MPGYQVREIEHAVGGHPYRLRVLSDTQQFADPDGHGERAGVSSATWSLFGQLWPSGALLAHAMDRFDIAGKRILELGCGIGLASLVLQRRGARVVASDIHPLAEPFLAYNAALNALPAVHYRQLSWDVPLLGTVVERHAEPEAEVLLTDPGRGHNGRFSKVLAALGFGLDASRGLVDEADDASASGHLLHYRRVALVA